MNKKNRNKGFSLVEIIVTIAIMAIVTGASMSIYSWVKSHKIKMVAGNVDDAISRMRTDTLSKGGTYSMILKKDASGKYVVDIEHVNGSETKHDYTYLDSKSEIYSKDSTTGTKYLVGTDFEIHISFNKTDGSFAEIKCYKPSTGTYYDIENSIFIEYSGLSKKIKLIKLTGKHYIE